MFSCIFLISVGGFQAVLRAAFDGACFLCVVVLGCQTHLLFITHDFYWIVFLRFDDPPSICARESIESI